MNSMAIKAIALGALAFLPGCIVYQYPQQQTRYVYATTQPYPDQGAVVVDSAPPPPQPEVVTVAPGPDFVWIPGIWFFEFGGWHWHGGYWGHRPYGGAVWFGGYWGHYGGGYRYHPGRWR